MKTSMDRRNFFKLAGASGVAIAAGAALAGCAAPAGGGSAPTASETVAGTMPVSFAEETDVLIIGTGIAGMSAAMDPVEAGLKVMLVDKLERIGGESFISCGVMNVSGSKMQKDAGIAGDPEEKWQKYAPVLEKAGETDDMDYKHSVYIYQTEWADRIAQDYGAVFQPITDYMNTGAPTSMLLPQH
ncbi:MAG: FAD-binding protein, partial [Raoultibacter sp.]